jgi:4a-hydroxytetrahydrobiopterin dehydratase
MAERLTQQERQALLPALGEAGWSADPEADAIRKIWKFRSFSEAWAFLSRVALLAEKRNHHPDWRNVFNVVDLRLTTHDCGGLSRLDIDMAVVIDKYAGAAEVQRDQVEEIVCLCQVRHPKEAGTPAP